MTVAAAIDRKLRAALAPARLDIIDESAQHAGHFHPGSLAAEGGAAEGGAARAGETHFRLLIVSARFDGQSRVARQRLIYQLLAEELAGGVHALAMTTLTPAEFAKIDA